MICARSHRESVAELGPLSITIQYLSGQIIIFLLFILMIVFHLFFDFTISVWCISMDGVDYNVINFLKTCEIQRSLA